MAYFNIELPNATIREMNKLERDTHKMLVEMVNAGADVVLKNVVNNVPSSWHTSKIMNCLEMTVPYTTPSDGAVNIKVAFYGYFEDKDKRVKIAPLVANVTEYGRSGLTYPKHPFLRKSFKKPEIEKAMLAVQRKYIKE